MPAIFIMASTSSSPWSATPRVIPAEHREQARAALPGLEPCYTLQETLSQKDSDSQRAKAGGEAKGW